MGIKSSLSPAYTTFILLIILLSAGLLAFFSLQQGHDWGGDFALYLRQSQSLLDGNPKELLAFNTYAMENSSEGPPSNPQIGPHLYPWGFPLLLLPVLSLAGFNFMVLKSYIILYFLLSLLVCYRLFKPRLGPLYSLMLVALLAFNPFLLEFNNYVFADIPFLFFSLLSLLFIEKTLGYRSYFINKPVTLILTGFLIFFSFLIRTNGIVLLGVLGLGHLIKWWQPLLQQKGRLFQKEWEELLPYASFALFMIVARLMLPSGSGSHLAFLERITPGKLAWNVMYYIELPAEFYEGVLFPMLLYGISVPFLIIGIWRCRQKMPDMLYLIFCAASMLVFILWPPVQGLRFIFPLLPFYLYFVFQGLLVLQNALSEKSNQKGIAWVPVFTLVLGVMFLISSISRAYTNYPDRLMAEGPYTAASKEAFAYLAQETEPQDVIVFFKPRVLSFMLDRQSLRITNLSELKEGKGDYLLYYKPAEFGQVLEEEYEKLRSCLDPAFENEKYVVYKLEGLRTAVPAKLAGKQ